MKKLAEWIIENDRKQKSMAAKIGISQSTLHGILNGVMPSLKTAYEIEKYTKKEIDLYDWLDEKNFDSIKIKPKKKPKKNKSEK